MASAVAPVATVKLWRTRWSTPMAMLRWWWRSANPTSTLLQPSYFARGGGDGGDGDDVKLEDQPVDSNLQQEIGIYKTAN